MSKFKKAKVVMLPTNEKANIYAARTGGLGFYNEPKTYTVNNQGRHLYIISDDEIKEGDWFYNIHSKIVGRAAFNFGKDELAKKIIATTDSSLGFSFKVNHGVSTTTAFTPLPQPSQQFIQKFVEEYNKGNIITNVLVEYQTDFKSETKLYMLSMGDNPDDFKYGEPTIKINPKDNSLNICFID